MRMRTCARIYADRLQFILIVIARPEGSARATQRIRVRKRVQINTYVSFTVTAVGVRGFKFKNKNGRNTTVICWTLTNSSNNMGK